MPLTLNEGSGGATVQALTDSNGYINPIGVVVYTTHLSTGEGDPDVVQFVDASHGLPVAQQGPWSVEASQSDASQLKATVEVASGQSIAVTQDSAGNLLCTASQGGTWNVGITGTAAVTQSGTWNLGTVTAVTAVGSITNPVQLASGTNFVGKVAAGADTSTIYNGTTALTPKFAKIDASSSGDNSIVALVSGKKIRVLRWSGTADGTVAIKWRSNTTDLTGARPLIQYASAGGGYCEVGHFETASGQALNLNLSAAVGFRGELVYIEV